MISFGMGWIIIFIDSRQIHESLKSLQRLDEAWDHVLLQLFYRFRFLKSFLGNNYLLLLIIKICL